ncbi:MAG: aconitase X [Lachnospiraceae bacterium]|jgi:predicted aconitase
MNLTREEQAMLDGEKGRLIQVAMENVVRYAEVLGAEELCKITKATVFCGGHNYLEVCESEDFHEVFTRMNMARNEVIPFDRTCPDCYIQSCVAACDQFVYEPLHQSKEFFEKDHYYIEEARKAGVTITGSCSPYLTGWIPVRGEHFVTTESGMTILGNSLWGACCNADGIEAAFWSAICGRTPKWGYHVQENRYGTHLVHIDTNLESITEWEVLGKAMALKLPATNCVPVIVGDFQDVDFVKLKSFFTALAITTNCRMCHIVGITPEAATVEMAFAGHEIVDEFTITQEDINAAYEPLCDKPEGEVNLVSLGCPHYDINQIKKVADYMKGKKVHPKVNFMVWTVYPIKAMADLNGYTKIIEEAGGHIFTSTCPTTIGEVLLKDYPNQVYDSLKQSGSVRSLPLEQNIYYTDVYRAMEAAISGQWKEEYRWKK